MAPQSQPIDPAIAGLFESSLGPVKPSTYRLQQSIRRPKPDERQPVIGVREDELSRTSSTVPHEQPSFVERQISPHFDRPKKRKHNDSATQLETQHLLRLHRAERESTNQHRISTSNDSERPIEAAEPIQSPTDDGSNDVSSGSHAPGVNPRWPEEDGQLEGDTTSRDQNRRTIFLSNVPITAVTSKTEKKILLRHLASCLNAVDGKQPSTAIESIRFRSTPYSNSGLPRKAAYITKAVMSSTAKSTHAYVVYRSQEDAECAVRSLNGTVILERHIRVDSISNPMRQDHRRCVFVGNLGFVDDETAILGNSDQKTNTSKAKKDADYEEGLWRTFGEVGSVESVRVIRDKTTRVSKGFAYVQFASANAVERALLCNDKKFPPLLPRKIRVMRARKLLGGLGGGSRVGKAASYQGTDSVSLHGRAQAARVQTKHKARQNPHALEGERATSGKRVKPRRSRRAADFKRNHAPKGDRKI